MPTLNLPIEIETLITTLFAESKCACHVINPNKTRVLMWKEAKDHQVTYYLKIGIQKLVSQEQTDRNGEIYWRYWTWEGKTEVDHKEDIVKTEALNHAKSATNSPEQSESTSH